MSHSRLSLRESVPREHTFAERKATIKAKGDYKGETRL